MSVTILSLVVGDYETAELSLSGTAKTRQAELPKPGPMELRDPSDGGRINF